MLNYEKVLGERVMIKEWSLTMRFHHWLMVICILVLIASGLYIGRPFTVYHGETIDKFFMGHVRYVHLIFGMILVFLFFWRLYLMFFSRFHADWRDLWAWTNFKDLWHQIKFYLLLTDEAPPHRFLYGPLQALAYLGCMIMIAFICLTGVTLSGAAFDAGFLYYLHIILKPIEAAMGGLAGVRWVHHILTWLFIIFIIVHIYMAFWYDQTFKEGTVSSMINGRVYRKKERME